jgi:hypothetical protein
LDSLGGSIGPNERLKGERTLSLNPDNSIRSLGASEITNMISLGREAYDERRVDSAERPVWQAVSPAEYA